METEEVQTSLKKKTKKEKKIYKTGSDIQQDDKDNDDSVKNHKFKKHKKVQLEENSISVNQIVNPSEISSQLELSNEVDRFTKKKKKHKKAKSDSDQCHGMADEEFEKGKATEHIEKMVLDISYDMVEETKGKKKKHKKKHCEKDFVLLKSPENKNSHGVTDNNENKMKRRKAIYTPIEDISIACVENGSSDNNEKKKKKRKAVDTHIMEDYTAIVENSVPDPVNDIQNERKKKKKKQKKERCISQEKDAVVEFEKAVEENLAGSVKKEKKRKSNLQLDQKNSESLSKKTKKVSTDNNSDNISLDEQNLENGVNVSNGIHKNIDDTDCEKKKKKKHKKNRHVVEEISEILCEENESNLEEKNVNCVTTNNSTNFAKLELTEEATKSACVGQWQGDMFESEERQSKFMRLLGGIKKNSGSIPLSGGNKLFQSGAPKKKGLFGSLLSKSTGNAALSTSAAADLNQKLEDDYNKALGFRLSGNKGAGFGFVPDPAEGKKFHIDVNKTKSVKFDD